MKGRVIIDRIGQKYGRLTVIGRSANNRHGQTVWRSRCVCGNEVETVGCALVTRQTQSCGCLHRERVGRPGAAFRQVLKRYRHDARVNKRAFELTEVEFKALLGSPCFYCGSPPKRVSRSFAGEEFYYNGIDRIDQTIGYKKNNCVACCTRCNFMKGSKLAPNEFIAQCALIAAYATKN